MTRGISLRDVIIAAQIACTDKNQDAFDNPSRGIRKYVIGGRVSSCRNGARAARCVVAHAKPSHSRRLQLHFVCATYSAQNDELGRAGRSRKEKLDLFNAHR